MTDDRVWGATVETVRRARRERDPLPGTGGFAGVVDGDAVRDVLGRVPLFVDGETVARDPTDLADPRSVPAGSWGGDPAWSVPDPEPYGDLATARDALADALASRDPAADAVAFSGGVDSAVVARLVDAPLYVAGYPDSPDVLAARRGADSLGRSLRVVELDDAAAASGVETVVEATGLTDPTAVAIAVPLTLVARRAAADGADRLALGQGADELFGGYEKVALAPSDDRLDAASVRAATREVIATLPEQLERDVLSLRAAGVAPVTPLLHDDVVRVALRLDDDHLVSTAGERKFAFRLAARAFVPDRLAFRSKRAVQYGSGVARGLERLAVAAGHERSREGVRAYLRSHVGDR
jgi:asparagine synthase (glutamine-hydrolysing)